MDFTKLTSGGTITLNYKNTGMDDHRLKLLSDKLASSFNSNSCKNLDIMLFLQNNQFSEKGLLYLLNLIPQIPYPIMIYLEGNFNNIDYKKIIQNFCKITENTHINRNYLGGEVCAHGCYITISLESNVVTNDILSLIGLTHHEKSDDDSGVSV